MPLQNDPRIYSGGGERLDSRPHVQLYANLMARKQARDDAFDEYIRNLNKNVNPAGMRNQERKVFEDKLNRWQQYGVQNKELLRNPRKDQGQASMEFQAGYQDLQNLIARSKGVEELKKPGVEIITDPNKSDRANKEKLMKGFQDTDQPLYVKDENGQWVDNPNWRPFSPTDIEFQNKPFDQAKFRGLFKDIKRQELMPEMVKDTKNMTQTVTKRSVFDQAGKEQIATIGVTEYMSDPSFRDVVNELNPKDWNDYFKQNFGRDINPQHEKADLAAAYALKTQQEEVITTDVKDDIFARQKAMEAIRNANARGLIRLRDDLKDADEATNDLWYDEFIDAITEESKGQPSKLHPGAGLGWDIPLNAFLSKGLTKNNRPPDKLVVTTEGKYVPVFYQRDEDGNIIRDEQSGIPKENKTLSVPISRDQLKVDMGGKAGVKQLNKEMSAGQKSSKPAKGILD